MRTLIDLSGEWQACLCEQTAASCPVVFPDTLILPGTTSQAGLGPLNEDRPEGFMTDLHRFEGRVWYRRSFDVMLPARHAMLTLERTRLTTVWLDGRMLGSGQSLCTPHCFTLDGLAAGTHELLIAVDNTGYPTRGGHLTSPDTSTNWNGITGEMSLLCGDVLVTGLTCETLPDLCSLRVRACVTGACDTAAISVDGYPTLFVPVTDGAVDAVYRFPVQPPLWDEYTPNLLTLRVTAGDGMASVRTGLRRLSAEGRRLFVNGKPAFLRGTHDGLAAPQFGAAPTDLGYWLQWMQTVRDWGLNHVRYHTCCPPEAAFEAADRLGLYLEPELPFWGTIAAPGQEGFNEEEQRFLVGEGLAMLRRFGHHPSFCLMSMGNELWGDPDRLDSLLAEVKSGSGDKLYTAGSNNFQWVPRVLPHEDFFAGVRLSGSRLIRGSYAMCDAPQGHVQKTEPESVHDYDDIIAPREHAAENGRQGRISIQYGTGVKEVDAEAADELVPQVPVVNHEIGQYTFYPDFTEPERLTGPLRERNFEVFAERLKERGLWDRHDRYFRAAGKLAVDCYRRELETAFRSEELAGFQLLDLKDFPGQGTALVGVLNAMMENKGLIEPEAWRRFCNRTCVLGCFDRFVLRSGDELTFGVKISECDRDVRHTLVTCTLLRGGEAVGTQSIPVPEAKGRVTDCGRVSFGVLCCTAPERLTVRLTLEDGTVNEYPLWLFADGGAVITEKGITLGDTFVPFVHTREEAEALGGRAVWVPGAEGKRPAEYCSDFWCFQMFRDISLWMKKPIPVGTMGLCIDPEHPAVQGFPADDFTTPPWYRLLAHAHCEPVDAACETPVAMIDNVTTAEPLAIIWRDGGVTGCTIRLWEAADEPEARCLASALAKWALA